MSDWKRLGDVATGMGVGDMRPRGSGEGANGVMTPHGWLSWEDVDKAGGRFINDAAGNRVLQFPTWTEERGRHFREIPEHKIEEGRRANERCPAEFERRAAGVRHD